ncbi:hypothetical protein TNCV_5040571 [Trichonephila clavipes]|nr:hypothetical protein TNCV_5040571 [Trichonephila clavipes]
MPNQPVELGCAPIECPIPASPIWLLAVDLGKGVYLNQRPTGPWLPRTYLRPMLRNLFISVDWSIFDSFTAAR